MKPSAKAQRAPNRPGAQELRALGRRDPLLAPLLRDLPAFPAFPDRRNPRQRSHYDALASAIVYQQLSGKAARTIWLRACALTPGPLFPRPHELPRLPDGALRGAGLSRNKLAALRDLAARVESGALRLPRLARLSDGRVIEELVEVRGIGEWSAHMFLMFRLGRLDVMAPGDLGVREGLRLLDGLGEQPTSAEALERAESWRPLRSVGCWLMWRLVERERALAADSRQQGVEGREASSTNPATALNPIAAIVARPAEAGLAKGR